MTMHSWPWDEGTGHHQRPRRVTWWEWRVLPHLTRTWWRMVGRCVGCGMRNPVHRISCSRWRGRHARED